MMDLSIVVPSIRVENWLELIESIKSSCGDVEEAPIDANR